MQEYNRKIWPYRYKHKCRTDVYSYSATCKDHGRLEHLPDKFIERFGEECNLRVRVIEHSDGYVYYFKNEDDYKWFIWACI